MGPTGWGCGFVRKEERMEEREKEREERRESGFHGATWMLHQYLTVFLTLFDHFNSINHGRG